MSLNFWATICKMVRPMLSDRCPLCPSVCLSVCLSGIRPVKSGGWWRWALLSPDGVVPSQMVGVSASVNLPLHHKVQKFSSGTGSPDGRDCGVEVK